MYRGSMVGPIHSPRFFSDPLSDDETHHFLDSCCLCKKPLGGGHDIYIEDTPFRSEECRKEQIEMDETKEKWKISVKTKEKSSSKFQKIRVSVVGTVVAG